EARRGPARNRGGRDHDVEIRDPLLECGLLLRLLLRGQLPRVAARRLLADDAEVEEARAERMDLLPHRRAHVEARDDGSEAAGRAVACRPATPAPRTSARAGATVPAAVVSIGKKRGRYSAASSTAL